MGTGPYKPGKNAVSASRLNETDMLARRPIRWGEGFEVTDTGTVMLVNLRQTAGVASAPVSTSVVRYAFIVRVHATHPQKVMVQFLAATENAEEGEADQGTSWANSGDVRVAKVPPNFTAVDFMELSREVFNVATPVVRADKSNGSWIVSLEPRWAIRKLPIGATITRCT